MRRFVCGNIMVMVALENAAIGETVPGHKHPWSHAALIRSGAAEITRARELLDADGQPVPGDDGRPRLVVIQRETFTAGDILLIKANEYHHLSSAADGTTVWCLLSHRDPFSGEVVERFNGWMEAYSTKA